MIADQFSKTRTFPWRDFSFLTNYITQKDKVLDLGCGNGRFYDLIKKKTTDYVGIDYSEKLIANAKKNYPNIDFRVADATEIPSPNNSFNKVLSVAVLHHIPSKKLQEKFFREIKRVLKPKGKLILSAWNLRENPRAKKLILKHNFLKILGFSKMDFGDVFYTWKNQKGEIKAQRYIHCFKKKEIKKLSEKAGLKTIELKKVGGIFNSNIFLVAGKD